jgi:hypothetical protein
MKRFRGEIGQDGGKRASYPGYSSGSFMATKRTRTKITGQTVAKGRERRRRQKAQQAGMSGKMFQICSVQAAKC